MSEIKERVLNGLLNVLFIGLPIALVVMFGENFSLWINFLAIGCVLFTSSVLAGIIGDEYESPKRILHALIGAAIAVCLKALAYPGHTTVIILATILVIFTADIINRGQMPWLKICRSARLHFLGKFILLTTFLFVVSLVVANFGSQTIWIPIVVAAGLITVLFTSDNYLDTDSLNEDAIIGTSLGILLLTGSISTVIQFRMAEIFWGIKLWEGMVMLATLAIIALVSIIVSKKRKRQAKLRELREKNAAEEQRRTEEANKRAAEEKEKKERAKVFAEQRLSKIEHETSLNAMGLSFLYEHNKDLGVTFISEKEINLQDLCDNITVSNNKKQIVWNSYFRDSLLMLLYVAEKTFEDKDLNRLIKVVKEIRADVKERKDKKVEYDGETLLFTKLQEIENAAKK